MAAVYNDGTVNYGTRVLTIATVAYVSDNVSVNRPTKAIDRTNALGEPSGSVGVADFITGSATVQLTTDGVEPENGQTFTETFDTSTGAETFYVTSVSRAESKDAEKKVTINFKKKYN